MNPPARARAGAALLLCCGCFWGCDDPAPGASPATSSIAQLTTSAASATGSAASPALKPSKAKAYADTKVDDLGTLPDGVGLAVGTAAPDFTLPDKDGQDVSLSTLLAKSHVLVVFYRGGW